MSISADITVAHVTAPAAFGGLERVVAGLSAAQVRRGLRVILITVLEPGAPTPRWTVSLREQGVLVEPLVVGARAYLAERRSVAMILRRLGAQIVHTHGERSDVLHLGTSRRVGLPIVSTVHGFSRAGLSGRLHEWVQVRALARFDRVVAVSEPLRERLRHGGVSDERLTCIQNGLVTDAGASPGRAAARARLGLTSAAPVVGWVGRLSQEKAPDVILRAFARLRPGAAQLCLVGDGPLMGPSRALAEQLGISGRVTFAGAVADAATLFGAFDLLALSSRTEGTPMVLLEAAAAGVPIVATAVGGVPHLIHADGGLVASEDPEALARAIESSLADTAGAIAAAGRLRARVTAPETAERWVDEYVARYRDLVGHP